jgi:cytochrome c-type biogenesis protein CcmH
LLLPALLRPNTKFKTDANAEKRAIFRQQFDELAQDKANGTLDESQFAIAESELERRVLAEADDASVLAPVGKPDRLMAGAILLLFPLLSIFLYTRLGNPLAIISPLVAPQTQTEAGSEAAMAELENMLVALQQKLANNPNDAKGWVVLARSLAQLQRFAEAEQAYEKATQLVKNDAQLLADYAEVSALAAGKKLAGKPAALIEKALVIDPQNIKALLLRGSVDFESKAYADAIVFWERALQVLPADAGEMKAEVEAMLNEVRKRAAAPGESTDAKSDSSSRQKRKP